MTDFTNIKNKQPQFLTKVSKPQEGQEKVSSEKTAKEGNIHSSDMKLSNKATNVFDKNYKLTAGNNFFNVGTKAAASSNSKDTKETNIFNSNLAAFYSTPEKTGATEKVSNPDDSSVFSGENKLNANGGNSIFGTNGAVNTDEYGGMLSFMNAAKTKAENQLASQGIKPGGAGAAGGSGDSSIDKLQREQKKLESMDSKNPLKANKIKKQGKKVEKAADEVKTEKTNESEDHKKTANTEEANGQRTEQHAKNEEKKAASQQQKAKETKAQANKSGLKDSFADKSKNANAKLINSKEQEVKKAQSAQGSPEAATKAASASGIGNILGANAPEGASSLTKKLDLNGAKMDNAKLSSVKSQEKAAQSKMDEGKATQTSGDIMTKIGQGLQLAGQLITTTGSTLKATGNIIKVAGQGLEQMGELVNKLGDACGAIPFVGPALKVALNVVGEGIKLVGKLLKDTVGPALQKTGEALSVTGKEQTTLGGEKVSEGSNLFNQGKQLFNDGKTVMNTVSSTTNSINNLVKKKCGEDEGSSSGSSGKKANQGQVLAQHQKKTPTTPIVTEAQAQKKTIIQNPTAV